MSPPPDHRSGFDPKTGIFKSLRPSTQLPAESAPHSAASFSLSLLRSSSHDESVPALLDASSSASLSFASLLSQSASLASALVSAPFNLSAGSVAFILAPSRLDVPVLYFALNSIGVVVSPANPASTPAELAHQINLSKPTIIFSVSPLASKLPPTIPLLLLDSPSFVSLLSSHCPNHHSFPPVKQSDTAAILYSSGTTGRVKGVILTNRNLIAIIADKHSDRIRKLEEAKAAGEPPPPQTVALFTIPLFHVFGFFMLFRAVTLGETTVLMERFDFATMLKAVERHVGTI